jgi:acyl-coenzyme A thioesterase PaaI-like protein
MPSQFAELVELKAVSPGRWDASIPDGWGFMSIPNGGLISSLMATALVMATDRPDPVTSTAHFLRPAIPGPCIIETEVIRPGRNLTTARAQLRQGDKLVAHLVASLGDLVATMGDATIDLDLPPMPPPQACLGPDDIGEVAAPPIAHRVNLRLHPDQIGFASGDHGDPVISGWVDVDLGASTALMALVVDALPPAFFNTGRHYGPLPTVELTVHTHARPAPGPVAARLRTDHAGPRYLEEDGWVTDSAGRLVAVSRQIALIPG